MSEKQSVRAIHASHPNGQAHPFKFTSLCGKLVRFSRCEIPGERDVTCKRCLSIREKICPTCGGTGMKNEP